VEDVLAGSAALGGGLSDEPATERVLHILTFEAAPTAVLRRWGDYVDYP